MRVLSLALWMLAAPAIASAQDAGVAPPCEIRGHLSVPDLHVLRAPGVLHLMSIDDRDVRVTPLGNGWFRVRTHGAGTRIDGRTSAAIPITIGTEHDFLGLLRVAAGARVDSLEPRGESLRATITLDEGVSLERAVVTCRDLAASLPTDSALDTTTPIRGPSWRARVPRFRVRTLPDAESVPLTIDLTDEARHRIVWIERSRRDGWVRIEAFLTHAHVTGWVRDSDLAQP